MAAAAEAAESLPRRVGFVGAGRMAEAIAQGLIRAGKVEAQHVLASAPTDRNLCHFRALGCQTTHSNREVLQGCSLIFFATKPHVLPAVLAEVAPVVTAEHILVSVAAGVSLSTLEELLPPTARVLRVSPNLPCVVQEGALVMARGRHAGSSEVELLRTLLEACGQCEEVPEAHVDVHTGLSGSGVAFRPWLKAPSRWACPAAWPTALLPRPCWGQPRCFCRRGSTRPSCGRTCARQAAPPSMGCTRWSRVGCVRPP
ncbi:pyrroline-5-carboxylate reductase 3 isoform X2 [Vicugna pacos]|uniref:Pyrroline-5-carboxylate reductase 3 isoform X2 n=1 Tax=Vicugna pacos TaxID=30538 RepID=A0ABM5CBE9_VICPA